MADDAPAADAPHSGEHKAGVFGRTEAFVKAHPYETAAAVFVGGAILIYLYYASGSSAASVASAGATSDPYAALAAQQIQADAISAQSQASLTALQDQLSAQTASINGTVQIASIQSAASLGVASLQAAALSQSIAAAASIAGKTLDTQLQLGVASIAGSEFATAASAGEFDVAQYFNAQQNLTATTGLYNYLNNAASFQYNEFNNQNNVLSQLVARKT